MADKDDMQLNFNLANLNKLEPELGRILISAPFLGDRNFNRSVILLVDHSEKGTLGIILNKPFHLNLNDTLKDFPSFETEVFVGGPVDNGRLFYIHTISELKDSKQIIKGLYWGGDFEQLKELAEQNLIKKDEIRFFIGYAGWEMKQLKDEIANGDWVVSECSINDVMNACDENCWRNALRKMGKIFSVIADFPIDPALN